jgi:hypothetical protein
MRAQSGGRHRGRQRPRWKTRGSSSKPPSPRITRLCFVVFTFHFDVIGRRTNQHSSEYCDLFKSFYIAFISNLN